MTMLAIYVVERASSTWVGPARQPGRLDRNRSGWLGPLRLISLKFVLGFGSDAGSVKEVGYQIQMMDRMSD